MDHVDLALVMPVYNESECIEGVVRDWDQTLAALDISYRIVLYNDGSKDQTAQVLVCFAESPRVQVIDKPNSGHGPTILQGYHDVVEFADWVFQCDSDGEMLPSGFADLWNKRDSFDALFGYRGERVQSKSRAFISFVSRCVVNLFFGKGVTDVNTPYRLMRAEVLSPIVANIPSDTFAPNVIISGELNRRKCRIYNTAVQHQHRRTGQVSIVKWGLWKAVVKSFFQTLGYVVDKGRYES